MPRTDPQRSFEVAVGHLFRTLNNVVALRRNPIVRAYFADTLQGAQRSIVARVHDDILACARTCCSLDTAQGLVAQAQRDYFIICALCKDSPSSDTASALCVST